MSQSNRSPARFEPLEGRQMLSVTPAVHGHGDHPGGGPGGGSSTIAFSLTPAAVQTGLTALATTDGVADPTATTKVALGNQDGVETYSVTVSSTGTVTRLTVDAAGDPVTAPTLSTTPFAALPSAAAAEITAIAAATDQTAPTSTTVVNVSTTAAGVATYSVDLTSSATNTSATTISTSTTTDGPPAGRVSVDAAGDPVGQQQLPLSVFSAVVQAALTAGAPTGATALTDTSTVAVHTSAGLTTYSVKYTVDDTTATVTVDPTGATVIPASQTTAEFDTLPTAVQQELQTLASAGGYSGTIADDQSVTVYTETGGTTVLYAVKVSVTSATTSRTLDQAFVTDASGNPTTLPGNGSGPGGPHGRVGSGGSTSSTGTTTTSTTASAAVTSGSTADAAAGRSGRGSPAAFAAAAGIDSPATPTLASELGLFASAATDTAVAADLKQLVTDAASLRSAVKGLSKAGAVTLRADQKTIAAAVKAIGSDLSADQKALRSDAATFTVTLRKDAAAVHAARGDATTLATAEAQEATDRAAAFAALSADLDALKSLISGDAGVTAAEAKLTTDLPTVAAAAATVRSDESELEAAVGTALADAAS